MAYSAIFGYFLGLAVLRRRQFWKLIGIGWVVSSTIHALWNTSAHISPVMFYVVAGVAGVFAAAAILKARQIEASELGRRNETFGSIVVDRQRPAPGAAQANAAARPQASATAPGAAAPAAPARPTASAPVAAAAAAGSANAQPPASAPASAPASVQALRLNIDGLMIPLRAGDVLDLGAEPALNGRGAGIRAEVVRHPTRADVLGLRNITEVPWNATLRDGTTQSIAPDRNIRLAPGVRIEFGQALTGSVETF
jgi:hypothetical protein